MFVTAPRIVRVAMLEVVQDVSSVLRPRPTQSLAAAHNRPDEKQDCFSAVPILRCVSIITAVYRKELEEALVGVVRCFIEGTLKHS